MNERKAIDIVFKYEVKDDYQEWNDDVANSIFRNYVDNIDVISNAINYSIIWNSRQKRLLNFSVNVCEIDEVDDVIHGNIIFQGSCDISGFEDSLRLRITVKDFKIYEIWAVDMDTSDEIAFVNNGKIVNTMDTEMIKTGPRSSSASYTFTYRGKV